MYEKLVMNKKFLWFVLLCFCLIISIPLYTPNLLLGHDTLFHITRIESIFRGIENGDFPIKLYGYFFDDYGYTAGFFYPDIFLYIPAFFRLLGFDLVFSYHLFLFLTTPITAILSWFSFTALFKHINKNSEIPPYLQGFAASILYTGTLYRFSDIYLRGALGEILVLCFFPMAIIFFYLMLHGEKKAWVFVVISSTCILESHILSSFLLFIAYLCMSLLFFKKFFNLDILMSVFKSTFFVALLNLWFYIPFFDMYNSFDFHIKNYVNPGSNIRFFSWDEMIINRCYIGSVSIVAIFVYLIYVINKLTKKNLTPIDKKFLLCVLFSVGFVLLMSPIAPWNLIDKIPIVGEKFGVLQYAFRLTLFSSFFVVIALTIAICKNKKLLIMALVIPLTTLLWMTTVPAIPENYLVSLNIKENPTLEDRIPLLKGTTTGKLLVNSFNTKLNSDFGMYEDYIYSDISKTDFKAYTDVISDEYWIAAQNKRLSKLDPNDITPKDIISNFSRSGLHLNFTTNAKESTDIKLPLWYYPHNWRATCDGKDLPVFESSKHRVTITAPAGEHFITVDPKLHTPYRNAYIISFIGFLLFLYFCFAIKKESGDK